MTEAEAKTKWCPFARLSQEALRQARGMDATCIASACMAWRPLYEDHGMMGHKVHVGGFCGLAGAPQS